MYMYTKAIKQYYFLRYNRYVFWGNTKFYTTEGYVSGHDF